ncbi:hypothetical protein NIES4102_31700 [Chondrocystis sp. NIES-4102]|nr:hypothetical protein NIES4102_31700 [Chondrocystis sp. NIES-4102]
MAIQASVKKTFYVSFVLFVLTYAAEGWMYAAWIHRLSEQGSLLLQLGEDIRIIVSYITALFLISFFVIVFTSPISLFTFSVNGWIKSDTTAFLSIFIGAFAFAIIVQRIDFFARFLVLTAAALLFKLDLQLLGCQRWLCSIILIIFGCLGFTSGILAFHQSIL